MRQLANPNRRHQQYVFLVATVLVLLLVALPLDFVWAQAADSLKPEPKPQLFTTFFYTRFLINLVSVIVLVMGVYLPIHRKKEFFFAFMVLNFLVFIIVFLISRTSAFSSMSMGLGLLAFFSLLRLRTDTISMKDMTYLFIVLTLGLVNASMSGPFYELISLDAAVIAITYGLDKEWLSKSIHVRSITVDNLDNIVPQQTEKLMDELRVKTGLEIQRIKVESVDLVKKRAVLLIYHY